MKIIKKTQIFISLLYLSIGEAYINIYLYYILINFWGNFIILTIVDIAELYISIVRIISIKQRTVNKYNYRYSGLLKKKSNKLDFINTINFNSNKNNKNINNLNYYSGNIISDYNSKNSKNNTVLF